MRSRGVSLIEAILCILLIAIAAAAVLSLSGNTRLNSVELMMERQALALAESQLAVVRAAPFTTTDPGSAAAESLTTPGPEAGEAYAGPSRLDNVNDYHGLTRGPGLSVGLDGTPLDYGPFAVTVTVAAVPSPISTWNGMAVGEMALITVRVTTPSATPGMSAILKAPVVLQGMRARHSPLQGPAP